MTLKVEIRAKIITLVAGLVVIEEEVLEHPGQSDIITIEFGCLIGLLAFAGTLAMYRLAKEKLDEIETVRASDVPTQSFVQRFQEKTTAIERKGAVQNLLLTTQEVKSKHLVEIKTGNRVAPAAGPST